MANYEAQPVISIIVPVYNVEKYLEKCINSLINQTITNIEIILVDDGSQDASGTICDQFEKKDQRIRVYHKKNEGLSSARNFGIDMANGEYIGFIDSDDYVDLDMYELLYCNLKKEDADISMCDLYHCYDDTEPQANSKPEYFVFDKVTAIKTVMEAKKTSVTAVNKLYKKELFDKVRYPQGKLSEDAFVIVELLLEADSIVLDTHSKYYYVHRKNSITTSSFKEKDLNVLEAYKKNMDLIRKHCPNIIDVAIMRYLWAHFYVLDKMILSDNLDDNQKKIQKKIVHTLRKNFRVIINDRRFNFSRKVAEILLMINIRLYRACVYLNRKQYVE